MNKPTRSTEGITRRGVIDLRQQPVKRVPAKRGRPRRTVQTPATDIMVRTPSSGIRQAQPAPRTRPRPSQPKLAALTKNQIINGLGKVFLYILIGVAALIVAFSNVIGQWALLIYGIVIFIRHIDSRHPFLGALFLLVTIPVFQLIHLGMVAENAAIYAYELLVIGVAAAILELRRPSPNKNHKLDKHPVNGRIDQVSRLRG